MTIDRIKICAIAAAMAATLTGEVSGQSTGAAPAVTSPVPAGAQSTTRSTTTAQQPADTGRARTDPTAPQMQGPASTPSQTQGPASTQPPSSRGLATGAQTQGSPSPNAPAGAAGGGYGGGAAATGTGAYGGTPSMSGVTPNRAELPGSAFTKLDAGSRGYVTLDDVRQLAGFESAFRQADQNGDGRLNASEFNSAWGAYTGNVR